MYIIHNFKYDVDVASSFIGGGDRLNDTHVNMRGKKTVMHHSNVVGMMA